MKKKKLRLQNLNLESFVTELSPQENKTVEGGLIELIPIIRDAFQVSIDIVRESIEAGVNCIPDLLPTYEEAQRTKVYVACFMPAPPPFERDDNISQGS